MDQVAKSEDDSGQESALRRQIARRREQLLVLSVAIICGLLGFPVHILWIAAIVFMAILWGYMASELGSSRRGGVVSNAVAAIASQAQDLSNDVTGRSSDDETRALHRTAGAVKGSGAGGDAEVQDEVDVGQEATKKELYEEAREAGIEGRSNMTKEELRQALDE